MTYKDPVTVSPANYRLLLEDGDFRMVEMFLPAGTTEADEVCARLTEDLEDFVVVGTVRLDNVLCYTDFNDTAVIAINQQNQARIDPSTAPYVIVLGRTDTRTVACVQVMVDACLLQA